MKKVILYKRNTSHSVWCVWSCLFSRKTALDKIIYTSDRQTIKSIGETIENYSLKQLDRPIYVLTDLVSFKLMAMSNVVWLIFDDWIKGHKTIADSFVSR